MANDNPKRWYMNPVVLDASGTRLPKVATLTYQDGVDSEGEPVMKPWYEESSVLCASPWRSGRAVPVGARCFSAGNVYVSATAGTTGPNAPTGTGSGISDGGVTWNWVVEDLAITMVQPATEGGDFGMLDADAEMTDIFEEVHLAMGRDWIPADGPAWHQSTPRQVGMNNPALGRMKTTIGDWVSVADLTLDTDLGSYMQRIVDLFGNNLDPREVW